MVTEGLKYWNTFRTAGKSCCPSDVTSHPMPTSCTSTFLLPQPWPTSPGSPQTFPQSSKIRGTFWLSRTLHQLWLMSLLSGQCLAIQIIKCVEYHPWEDNGMQNLFMFFLSSSLVLCLTQFIRIIAWPTCQVDMCRITSLSSNKIRSGWVSQAFQPMAVARYRCVELNLSQDVPFAIKHSSLIPATVTMFRKIKFFGFMSSCWEKQNGQIG